MGSTGENSRLYVWQFYVTGHYADGDDEVEEEGRYSIIRAVPESWIFWYSSTGRCGTVND